MENFTPTNKPVFTEQIIATIDIGVIYTSMVASKESIFVFGGDTKGFFIPSAEVRRYDISEHTWHHLKEMPHYRWGATAQIIDDKIFIMGGGRACTYTSSNLAYKINDDSWYKKESLPVSRKGLVSGIINGIIYITGGHQLLKSSAPTYCYAYNPKNDTWRECQPPIHHRSFAMSVVIDNFLYVLGGCSSSYPDGRFIVMERYSPETNNWEIMPSMPRSRKNSVAVAIDSKIFVLCGKYNDNYVTIDYYDTKTREWTISDTQTPSLLSPGVTLIDNKIYLTGGLNNIKEYNINLYEITYDGIRESIYYNTDYHI